MEPEDLPDAGDLWWSWVVLAALHRAVGDDTCRLEPEGPEAVLVLEGPGSSWLRAQRTLGSRSVLWGRSELAPAAPSDARRQAPDWALTPAVASGGRPTVVAWHVHGEWDATHTGEDEGLLPLLRPLLAVDPRLVALAREDRLGPDDLAAALHDDPTGGHPDLTAALDVVRRAAAPPAATPTGPPGSVPTRLRDQVHQQMRDAAEAGEDDGLPRRVLLQRPPAVVQWARVQGPGLPFTWSVMGLRGDLVEAAGNTRLPEPVARSLTNVLHELHREEAGEESGAWLFARVRSEDGVVVALDRAFDSWPAWFAVGHADRGPSLEDLAWEMEQRTPAWRPAWASLLPAAPTDAPA